MSTDRLEVNEELFKILEDSLEGSYIFMCDIKSRHFRWSKSAREYFNFGEETPKETLATWIRYIHPDDRHIFEEDFQRMMSGESSQHSCEYRVMNRYGIYVWLMCKASMRYDEEGRPAFFAGAMTNLGHIGKYDATTNLKNIYEFRSDLFRWMYNMDGARGQAAIMMIGINGFSHINEKYTYLFGNSVLRVFSKLLLEHKDEKMTLYRMDGDKFVCFCPGASKEELEKCFERFQDCAQHRVNVEGKDISFSISGGALLYPDNGTDIEVIHRNLEYTLQWAKKNSRKSLEFFSEEILNESLREMELLEELMESVQDNFRGFYLCYQPIIHTYSGELYSCEALTRWKDKNGKRVPPLEFIPLLESTGDIVEVGNWILETGLAQLAQWQKFLPGLKMNINVSYLQFQNADFPDVVMRLLKKYQVMPECLVLELTETCKIVDMAGLRTEFEYFRNRGVQVALDDFGTGYASVSSLKELPIDSVKIDHGFVSQLTKNQTDRHIIEYLINLSQKLGIEVCVEGIETAAIRNIVQSFAPDTLQGYFFSHPLEAEDFFVQFVRK